MRHIRTIYRVDIRRAGQWEPGVRLLYLALAHDYVDRMSRVDGCPMRIVPIQEHELAWDAPAGGPPGHQPL